MSVYKAVFTLIISTICLLSSACNAETKSLQPDSLDAIRLLSVVDLQIKDPSGLALDANPDRLWTVSDESGGRVYLISLSGEIISELFYSGDDMEGITYDPVSETLWIVEERLRQIVQLGPSGQVLQRISVDIGQEIENDGPEGIAINSLTGHMYVANEKNPMVIMELDTGLEIISVTHINFEGGFAMSDISGLFHEPERDELWILSDISQKIVVTDTGLNPIRWYHLDVNKPEGIAVDMNRRRVYIVSDQDDKLYTYELYSLSNLEPFRLDEGDYRFNYWSPDEPNGNYPPNMVFQQSNRDDPGLTDEMTGLYLLTPEDYHSDDSGSIGFPYRLTRRTRINGLGAGGISMINTGQGRDLGAVVLAIDTRGMQEVLVDWLGGTVQINNRMYAIQLQYRTQPDETFRPLMHNGETVIYARSEPAGHSKWFRDIPLPADALGKANVQLRWKFYFTGTTTGGGGRDELRIGDIFVRGTSTATSYRHEEELPGTIQLHHNFPNPFNPATQIRYSLPETSEIKLDVFNAAGQRIARLVSGRQPAGDHAVTFDASGLASGMYVYRLSAGGMVLNRSMLLLK
ncbi:MAG: T9SS C-terminal target domain-containing protein [Balneolaceae bacterium]|nr:MAG: T9SS C-terminal target domain-containing protein [Balneolaceae bacterium]